MNRKRRSWYSFLPTVAQNKYLSALDAPSRQHILHLCSLLILCSTFIIGTARAQDFSVERWTTRNGLRTSAVTSVTQTTDGKLWIGTRAGLVRFDGSQFQVFTPRNLSGMRCEFIDYVATGLDSTLYVGTDDRVCVFNQGKWRSFALQRDSRASKVLMILPVGKDEAWIGTSLGLLFHYSNGETHDAEAGFASDVEISGLARTNDGTLWLATTLGLFAMHDGKPQRYTPEIPLPTQALYDLAVSPDGTLFAASDVGLFNIRGKRWKQWSRKSGLPSNEINVLTTDGHGVLWIGTQAGLARLSGGVAHRVNSVSCGIQSLFIDTQKSLWVGCNDSVGLFRLRFHDFPFLVPPPSLQLASASLALDNTGAVWIGARKGLYRFANKQFRRFTRREGLPNETIFNVSSTPKGVVWVSTADGLARIDKGRITPVNSKPDGFSQTFFFSQESIDGTLWALSEQGLSRRLPGQTAMSLVPEFTNLIRSIYQDPSGAVWVSTNYRGLFRFEKGTIKVFSRACGIGSDTVYGSVQDDSGTMWVWTYGGLSRIRKDICANIPPDAGLPNSQSGSIAYDGAGHIWLRTEDGVAAISINEANYIIDHPGPLTQTRIIGSEQGLDSALTDPEVFDLLTFPATHQIWVPTASGIAQIDASPHQPPPVQMRPQISSLMSDSGEHDLSAPVRLQPGDLHLHFTYRVPSLLAEPGRMYRYRLVGLDKVWLEGKGDEDAVYSSIPPGKYEFEVSSRGPFEQWLAASHPVEVTILPHFYQTWWWYTILSVSALFVIWLGYWYRLVAVRRQFSVAFAERDYERLRLARELHDTLSRGMMAIHMQLQLARAYLPSQPESACSHLDSAVEIVRDSSADTRKSIAALRSTEEKASSLQALFDRAVSNFHADSGIPVDLRVNADFPVLPPEMTHEISRILSEALSNVQQHSSAKRATLSAAMSGRILRIVLADDGVGFDDFTSIAPAGHFGIQGMRERAKRIRAQLSIKSSPGSGTIITLTVHLPRSIRYPETILRVDD